MKTHSIRDRLLASTMVGGAALMALTAVPALTLLTPTAAHAQNLVQGAMSGTVSDQAGTPLAGATVNLRSVAQGFTRSFTTDASGSFRAVALPQGSYEVTVEAPGFNTLTETVSVGAGGTTSLVFTVGQTAVAGGATAVDEIVVVGVRQAVSEFDATTTGLTVNVEELARNVPIGRDSTSVALLAPGVTESDSAFGSLPTIGGSSAGENTYFINGLNITKFRDFTGSSTVPFEFYQTIETKTGGYSAEFGRGTGGVLNGTTKSGGNEWEFGLTGYYSPDALRNDSPNTYTQRNQFDESESSDLIFDFGGPIIQDRLFLFGLYNMRDRESFQVNNAYTGTRVTSDDPFYGAKVDFLLTDDHRLEFTYFSDEQEQQTQTTQVDTDGSFLADNGTSTFKFGGENWIARYTGVWTDWLTTSVAYGINEYNEENSSPGDSCALITSTDVTVPRLGCWLVGQPQSNFDEREVFRADVDIYANFMGEHHFRLGYDAETLTAEQLLDYSGQGLSYCRPGGITATIACTGEVTGGLWYRYQTALTAATLANPAFLAANPSFAGRTDLIGQNRNVRVRAYDNDGGFESVQNAYYIQDSWEVTDRLTLNLGLRNEGFENSNLDGVAFIDLQDQWAPRLGATFDVFGDRSAKLFGFWGRYFLPVAVNTNTRLAGAEFFIQDTWTLDVSGGANDLDANGIDDDTDEPILGTFVGATNLADGTVKSTAASVDAEIDPMYVDEFILGYEQEIWNDWTIGIKGQYREIGTAIDDVAIDAAVLDYCEAEGGALSAAICYNVWSGFHQYVLTNPGEDMVITLDGDDLSAATGGAITEDREITLTADQLGYPEPDRTYKAVEFSLEKPFDGVWGGRFSYVWSENKGNYEGALKSDNGQTDPGLSQDFDQPGLTDNSYGYLPNHRAHAFKAFGSWQATENLLIGANLLIQSPRQFGCIGVHPTDLFASFYGAASFFCDLDGDGTSEDTPRGEVFEGEWLKSLDLTFSYNLGDLIQVPGDSLTLRADVFNVFDASSKQDFNEFGEFGDHFPGPGSADPDFRQVTGYQSPRSVRFSVAYRF